jgi:GR25 family glycosyltransferase involved in LPS biosynthesis
MNYKQMDKVDILYYINLDYRTDRKLEFLDWIEESGFPEEKVERIQAVATPGRGHVGCLLSHIKVLDTFLESSHKICMLFEDDYQPLKVEEFLSDIGRIFDSSVDFDIVMLSYNELKSDETEIPFLHKVNHSFTASGFIITRTFAKILKDFWESGIKLLLQEEELTKRKCDKYMNDVYWMELMPVSKWFCYYPRLGIQRPSFSDLQMHHTAYNA